MEAENVRRSDSLQNESTGLRRINVQKLDNIKTYNKEVESESSHSYGSIASSNTQKNSKENIDNKKIQLLNLCEIIRTQQRVWPVLVEIDTQIKLLSQSTRQTIDSCNINEGRLDWLLEIHKFQVSIEEIVSTLTTLVNNDIEHVLMLRVRSNNGIIGLHLKAETINAIKNMQKEVITKSLKA